MSTPRESLGAARIYLALALLAAGREIDGPSLEEGAAALGLGPDPAASAALSHLVREVRRLEPRLAAAPAPPPPTQVPASGLYVYGIAAGALQPLAPDLRGVDGSLVVTLRYRELIAIAHHSPARPYATAEQDLVMQWAQEHAHVLEAAVSAFASVIPFQFNVIVEDGAEPAPDRLAAWLGAHYEEMQALAARLRGRREYGVRIEAGPRAASPAAEPAASSGLQYLRQAKDERDQARMEAAQDAALAERCLGALRQVSAAVEAEPTRDTPGLVLKCSCLVDAEGAPGFLQALEDIESDMAVRVEVTGPWPAYTFARLWASMP